MAAKENIRTKLTKFKWHGTGGTQLGVSSAALTAGVEAGIHFLLTAVLAGAVIFERSAPFGVAMVAASGTGLCGGASLLGACLGYMTLMGFSDGLRYCAAAVLTFAVGFAFYDFKPLHRPWVMATIAGLLNGCTGFIYLSQGGWKTVDVIYFITEVALTVVAARCYRAVLLPIRSGRRGDSRAPSRRIGLCVLVCTTLMALAPLYLYREISLGRAVAVVIVLSVAWQGGSPLGSMLGVTIGLSMDLSGAGIPVYAMAYGLSSLAAGLFRGQKRVWSALAYVLANSAAVMWTWDMGLPLSILYEVFIGSVVFMLIPGRALSRLGAWMLPGEVGVTPDLRAQQMVRQQLEGAAEAFHGLYDSINSAFRLPENDGDVGRIFDRAAGQVCKTCVRRSQCWERDYASTYNSMNDATAAMVSRGRGEAADFPRHFADRCLHFPAYLGAVNRELTGLLYRRQYNSRIRESRSAVAKQYGQLADLLGNAAAELAQELIPDQSAQRRLRQRMIAMGLELNIAAFRDSKGMMRVELSGAGCQTLNDPKELKTLSALLKVPLRAEGEGDSLTLIQQEPLMAVAGVAARKKDGETVSGDAGTYFKGPDGSLYVLLCDGMGSGLAANRESSLAVRLLEQFLQAGVETEHALTTLSSALALRGEDTGGFTTIDLLRVDLFTGRGAVYKLGAAPTYVKKGKEVGRISGTSLPAGLQTSDRDRPDKIPVQLSPGDCVLLVSDGIAGTGDDSWIREMFGKFDGTSPKELARELIAKSPQGATDDRTALVVRIEKRK